MLLMVYLHDILRIVNFDDKLWYTHSLLDLEMQCAVMHLINGAIVHNDKASFIQHRHVFSMDDVSSRGLAESVAIAASNSNQTTRKLYIIPYPLDKNWIMQYFASVCYDKCWSEEPNEREKNGFNTWKEIPYENGFSSSNTHKMSSCYDIIKMHSTLFYRFIQRLSYYTKISIDGSTTLLLYTM